MTDRLQQVTINGEISCLTSVTPGVPQGTVFALLLFLCYINDMTKDILSSIKLYTDGVLIYNIINSEEDCKIAEWLKYSKSIGYDLEDVIQLLD